MHFYRGQLKSVAFNIKNYRDYRKKPKKGSDIRKKSEDILTLDIETTSSFLENGKVIPYSRGRSADYWNSLQPLSLCYIWQFSFNNTVYFGREWKDFKKVIDDLPEDVEFIIWIHNAAFEFQYLSELFEWDSVFARSPHKPIKFTYKKIEFRCTYMLTRLSLDSWGKELGYYKAVGMLNYNKIRTPLTKLDNDELFYAERDCRVVYRGIMKYRERYGSIWKIPLTQTGTVREPVKTMLSANEDYMKQVKKCVPNDAEELLLQQDIFAGGYTHTNRLYAGQFLFELLKHKDYQSDYPFQMAANKFPFTPWIYKGIKHIPDESMFEEYAYIFKLHFTNIRSTKFNTYLQASKCSGHGFTYDNGRIISGSDLIINCTEQDWLIIKESYEWEKLEVEEVYESKKAYLPKEFIEYILELYGNKTSLKDVEGMEDLYAQSKQYINSLFGMMVTQIMQADVYYDSKIASWKIGSLTKGMVNEKLKKLRSHSPYEKRYFLNYSAGVWVTAYARRSLWRCILHKNPDGTDNDILTVYGDTDSLFMRGNPDFTWYNDEVIEKLHKMCDFYGIDFEKTRPKTKAGKAKQLGIFAEEDDCVEFCSLGAKRYIERRASDKKLHLTISGINKDAVKLLNNDITNFKNGLNFNKDALCVKKKLLAYLTDQPEVTYPDGYHSTYKFGINMRNTGYELSVTDEYQKLIKYMEEGIDIPEEYIQHMRGVFEEDEILSSD